MTDMLIPYEVKAFVKYEAIAKAVDLLRSDVRVLRVEKVTQTAPDWWEVVLRVDEPTPDHPADATVEGEYAR